MKSILLFTIFYISLSLNLHGVNTANPVQLSAIKEQPKSITLKDFIHSNNKEWANRVGKKLKWQEKLALNILRKRIKKEAKANPIILNKTFPSETGKFNINDFALYAGITSLVSALLLFLGGGAVFVFISLIVTPIAIITGLIGLNSGKPGKKKAVIGFVIGLVIGGLWIWLFSNVG